MFSVACMIYYLSYFWTSQAGLGSPETGVGPCNGNNTYYLNVFLITREMNSMEWNGASENQINGIYLVLYQHANPDAQFHWLNASYSTCVWVSSATISDSSECVNTKEGKNTHITFSQNKEMDVQGYVGKEDDRSR